MTTNMPPSSAKGGSLLKSEVKADPDGESKPSTAQGSSFGNPIRFKKEEPEDDKIDQTIPEASDGEDMFNDVDEEDDNSDGDVIVDLTYEGLVTISGVEHFVCETFKIRQIPQPKVLLYSLKDLFGCLQYGSIVLNPNYQREVVWDEHRASTLINSILMGYFVPPIIFNHKLIIRVTPEGDEVKEKKRICVDGKQRLTSLQKFMTGQIGIADGNNPQKKWYFCHPVTNGQESASTHNIMPKAVRDFFVQKTLCCYEYDDLSQDTEENMFQLVQRGIALTPAEKMRALSTDWANFGRQYEEDYSMIVNLSKQNRASGFRLVVTIFAMVQEVMSQRKTRNSAPTLQASPQALNRLLEDKKPLSPALKLKFKAIFDRIEAVVKLSSTQITSTKYVIDENSTFDPAPDFLRGDDVAHVRTFSPLELVGTAILVAYHMESRTNEQMLMDVKEMRRHLRLNHKDLRVNAQCWSTVWEYIRDLGRERSSSLSEPPSDSDESASMTDNGAQSSSATAPSRKSTRSTHNKGKAASKAVPKPLQGIAANRYVSPYNSSSNAITRSRTSRLKSSSGSEANGDANAMTPATGSKPIYGSIPYNVNAQKTSPKPTTESTSKDTSQVKKVGKAQHAPSPEETKKFEDAPTSKEVQSASDAPSAEEVPDPKEVPSANETQGVTEPRSAKDTPSAKDVPGSKKIQSFRKAQTAEEIQSAQDTASVKEVPIAKEARSAQVTPHSKDIPSSIREDELGGPVKTPKQKSRFKPKAPIRRNIPSMADATGTNGSPLNQLKRPNGGLPDDDSSLPKKTKQGETKPSGSIM